MAGKRASSKASLAIAIFLVLVVLAILTPASAAQNFVVAGPGSSSGQVSYYTRTVIVQKGKMVNFINLDIAPHDVTHKGGLFYSKTIGVGKQTGVTGVKNLKKGVYNFYCTIHPSMKGVLRVI